MNCVQPPYMERQSNSTTLIVLGTPLTIFHVRNPKCLIIHLEVQSTLPKSNLLGLKK